MDIPHIWLLVDTTHIAMFSIHPYTHIAYMYVHCSTSQSVELLVWYQDTKVWSVINVQCTSQIRRGPNHTLSMRRSQSVCIFQIIQQLVLLYANISDQQKSSTNAGGETRITFTFAICAQWRCGKTMSPQIMLSKPEAWGLDFACDIVWHASYISCTLLTI